MGAQPPPHSALDILLLMECGMWSVLASHPNQAVPSNGRASPPLPVPGALQPQQGARSPSLGGIKEAKEGFLPYGFAASFPTLPSSSSPFQCPSLCVQLLSTLSPGEVHSGSGNPE